MLKIGIDFDDVLAPFNSIACKLATRDLKIDPPLSINDIDSWENTGRASVIKEYYYKEELYDEQLKAIDDTTRFFVNELVKIADVYIISAAYPDFMGIRAKQILKAFPEIDAGHIILGAAKHLVQFDIILDDNICNVLNSPAEYPVLMRKPWNRQMTGILSVNSLLDFYELVKHIMNPKKVDIKDASIIALVGPSGSRKNELKDSLCQASDIFTSVNSYSTKPQSKNYLSREEFAERELLEKTVYGGYEYGLDKESITWALADKKVLVIPIDMCGAIGLKRFLFNEEICIVYCKRNKQDIIMDILESDYVNEEKTLRILSIETEKKNKALCDMILCTDNIPKAKDIILTKRAL